MMNNTSHFYSFFQRLWCSCQNMLFLYAKPDFFYFLTSDFCIMALFLFQLSVNVLILQITHAK